jgi:hexosaminidase
MKVVYSGIVIFILIVFSFTGWSQNYLHRAFPVTYHWEYDSLYINKPGKIKLIIKNISSNKFSDNGWKIYFNSYKYPQLKDSSVWLLHHVNGDLYYLKISNTSQHISPGKSLKVSIELNEFRNETDFPGGLYLVWDDNNTYGIPIKYAVNENSGFPFEYEVYKNIFLQNKLVRPKPNLPPQIFPTPVKVVAGNGKPFTFGPLVLIKTDPVFKLEAQMLMKDFSILTKTKINIAYNSTQKTIILKKINLPNEAYNLDVNAQRIIIAASSASGIFYGIQSLKTLLPAKLWAKSNKTEASIAPLKVFDEPRFKERALMIDVARNFKSKKEIFKILDVMSLYKLNMLHLHLNDDEGWRLQIPGLPELTAIGSKRGHSNTETDCLVPSFNSGPDPKHSYGSGYYSKQDYMAILKYATQRHIAVIPEIESPGHARAAIKSMYARYINLCKSGRKNEASYYLLQDINDTSVYRSVQGWNDNVIDVTLPSTYHFIEKITNELVKMYAEAQAPLNTIHFGGDETPKGVWEKSPAVLKFRKDHSQIKTTADLWKYYFERVSGILNQQHLYLSGWEEVGLTKKLINGKLYPIPDLSLVQRSYHLQVWNNMIGTGMEDLAYHLANIGYKVLLSNVTNLYFDMPYTTSFYEPGYYWAGYTGIDKPYYFIPLNYYKNVKEDELDRAINPAIFNNKIALTDSGKQNITGLQGAIWGEGIQTDERLEYMLLPKLLSLAERAWAPNPEWAIQTDSTKSHDLYLEAWSAYINVISQHELPRLDYYSGGYTYRIPDPGILLKDGKIYANAGYPGFTIRFTTDNTEPDLHSKKYQQAIFNNGHVKLKEFNAKGRGGKTITINDPQIIANTKKLL